MGKSKLIEVISQHCSKVLTKSGSSLSRPSILILGPTGIAASLIGNHIFLMIILYRYIALHFFRRINHTFSSQIQVRNILQCIEHKGFG